MWCDWLYHFLHNFGALTEATSLCGRRVAPAACLRKFPYGFRWVQKGLQLEKQHITHHYIMFAKIYQECQADEFTSSEFLVSIQPGEKMVSVQLGVNFKNMLYHVIFILFHPDSYFQILIISDFLKCWFMIHVCYSLSLIEQSVRKMLQQWFIAIASRCIKAPTCMWVPWVF